MMKEPSVSERDLAALASHMGLRAFHDWMRAMLSGDTLPVGGGAWDEDAGAQGNLAKAQALKGK